MSGAAGNQADEPESSITPGEECCWTHKCAESVWMGLPPQVVLPCQSFCRTLQKHRQDDLSQCTVGRRKPAAGQAAGQPRWQPGALRRPALQHLCSSVQGRLCEAHRLEWRPAGVLISESMTRDIWV